MIRVALPSVFPFSEPALAVGNLHLRFFLVLAETLDTLLLNSLSMEDSTDATATYRLSFRTNLEPLDLPR
ncbi:hypothetical protein F5X97DRAFT_311532 [Nemania serpens]|nr:hypothetical protein F5X97DRAFT_311532 [Nemania serpens]